MIGSSVQNPYELSYQDLVEYHFETQRLYNFKTESLRNALPLNQVCNYAVRRHADTAVVISASGDRKCSVLAQESNDKNPTATSIERYLHSLSPAKRSAIDKMHV
jgi:hypothetical protein